MTRKLEEEKDHKAEQQQQQLESGSNTSDGSTSEPLPALPGTGILKWQSSS